MKTAEEFLDNQNYSETATLPNKKVVSPSFGRTTVTRLMEEYANEILTEHDKEIKELIDDTLLMDGWADIDTSFCRGFRKALIELKAKINEGS